MKSPAVSQKKVIRTTNTAAADRQSQGTPAVKPATPKPTTTNIMRSTPTPDVLTSQRLLISAQRELEIARKLRMQAQRYLQDTEMKARSEAQRLILSTRLMVRKETEELIRQANEEIQKVLADIRVIRITAQEELAAQKKFTDAARLRSFTLSLQKDELEPEVESVKKPARKKQAVH
jgi:vacuolar-type H+-ATPase subunit H